MDHEALRLNASSSGSFELGFMIIIVTSRDVTHCARASDQSGFG